MGCNHMCCCSRKGAFQYTFVCPLAWLCVGADTCAKAALHGHLKVLKYAHRHGCPWDAETCANAALGGHLVCLIYAHDNGCPWDKWWTFHLAAQERNLDVLEYLFDNGCPWKEEVPGLFLGGRRLSWPCEDPTLFLVRSPRRVGWP
jgi:hypothetical protein